LPDRSVQYMVCYDVGQQAEKHTKTTNGKTKKQDASQILMIYMDDQVLLGMNKNPEEMAQEICLATVVK